MAEETVYHKSVRFFPSWNQYTPNQIIGFINMICHILEKKPVINNWVELGSFIGESANLVLGFPSIKHIDCVDSCENLMKHLNNRLIYYTRKKVCSIHNKKSQEFLNDIPKNYMDVVYIDANHEYDSVKLDIDMSFDKLQKYGFLCGHDYNTESPSSPGVVKAVDECSIKHGLPIIRFIDNSWLMEKR